MKYCDTTKLSIRQIDKRTAKKMVVKYHYSKLWTKCSVALGLFHQTGNEHAFFDEPEEKMIGVIVYGDPIGRLTGQSISDEIDRTEELELTRLFIHDGYGSNIESWFISQSMNWLRKNRPEIKALVSYADPKQNHPGTIYQLGLHIQSHQPSSLQTHQRNYVPYLSYGIVLMLLNTLSIV